MEPARAPETGNGLSAGYQELHLQRRVVLLEMQIQQLKAKVTRLEATGDAYRKLERQQVDLDPQSRSLLIEKAWELYE